MPLTKRQRELLDFVEGYVRLNGYSPSYHEIAGHIGVRAISTVHAHVTVLVQKGLLRKGRGESRSLEVVPEAEMISPEEVACPSPENGYTIPPHARYVPVAALEPLFHAWQRKRQHPDAA